MTGDAPVGRGGSVDLARLKRNRELREQNRTVVEELTADIPVETPVAPVVAPIVPVVQAEVQAPAVVPVEIAVAPVAEVPPAPVKEKPVKTGFFQSKEQGDRMRRTYFDTSPMTQFATLSEFICNAIEKECARLEAQYNDGEPFTSDPGQVRRGRPIGR